MIFWGSQTQTETSLDNAAEFNFNKDCVYLLKFLYNKNNRDSGNNLG